MRQSYSTGSSSLAYSERQVTAEIQHVQNACVEFRESSPSPLQRSSSLYQGLEICAQSKLALLASSQAGPVPTSYRRTRNTVQTLVERSQSAVRSYGKYFSHPETHNGGLDVEATVKHVLIEWKDFDPASPLKVLIDQQINSLAGLLSSDISRPSEFRALEHNTTTLPTSLYELLGKNEDSSLPDLGQKFDLAKQLASSILRLHDCGWIHGSFRYSNVIFFDGDDGDRVSTNPSLSDPFVVGFNYSRPSNPDESTLEYSMTHFEHDLYRHPQIAQFASKKVLRSETERHQFHVIHDLYALGIVLLYLGLWRRISSLWKDKYNHARFLEKLLQAYMPRLGLKMGTVYRDVVEELLSLVAASDCDSIVDLALSKVGRRAIAGAVDDTNRMIRHDAIVEGI